MPIMEAGLFAILAGMAFIFMMVSFKFGALFKIFSGVIFFALAVVLFAEYDVAYTTIQTTTAPPSTTTDIRFIIQAGDGTASWLAWVFVGLGVFNSFMFFIEMIPR